MRFIKFSKERGCCTVSEKSYAIDKHPTDLFSMKFHYLIENLFAIWSVFFLSN